MPTGYKLQRKLNDGEWIDLEFVNADGIGELQTPLTLTGQLDGEKIIIEGS